MDGRKDVVKASLHASASFDSIPVNRQSVDVNYARYISWELMTYIHANEYATDLLLKSTLKLIELAPLADVQLDISEIFYNPAFALAKDDRFEEALAMSDAFFEYAQQEQDIVFANHVRARVLVEMSNYLEAIPYFQTVAETSDNEYVREVAIVQAAKAMAQTEQAIAASDLLKSIDANSLSQPGSKRDMMYVEAVAIAEAGDYKTAFEAHYNWAQAEVRRLQDRIDEANRSARLALSSNAEILDARMAEQAEREARAEAERMLIETQLGRTRVVAALAGALALLMVGAFAYVLRQLRRERRWRLREAHMNEEIERLGVKAESAKVAKQRFVSMMSHEMRTPLNHVIPLVRSFADRMRGSASGDQLAGIVDRGTARLLRMSDEITMLAGGEDTMIFSPGEFAVSELVDDIVLEMEKGYVLSPELDLHVEHADDMPAFVATDKAKLSRALLALVENAQKFGDGKPVTLRFDFETRDADQDCLVVDVIDAGGGIDAADVATIMEPFMQADMGLTRPADGMGLGLNLVSLLCRVMGARFSLDGRFEHVFGTGVRARVQAPAHATDGSGSWTPAPEPDLRRQAREVIRNGVMELAA